MNVERLHRFSTNPNSLPGYRAKTGMVFLPYIAVINVDSENVYLRDSRKNFDYKIPFKHLKNSIVTQGT
jgi:hypothetical protein